MWVTAIKFVIELVLAGLGYFLRKRRLDQAKQENQNESLKQDIEIGAAANADRSAVDELPADKLRDKFNSY